MSPERLYELVNQTLMENFGPLGSFAITRRKVSDTDDIFHTALARSVARDIVANLAEHGITVRETIGHAAPVAPLAPVERFAAPLGRSIVPRTPAVAVASTPAPTPTPAAGLPAIATEPLEDDALRALVAHHNEVTEAAAKNTVDWTVAN